MKTENQLNEAGFHIPEIGSYQGELELRMTINGQNTFSLKDATSGKTLLILHSGAFDVHNLLEFGDGAILQVSGFLDLGSEPYVMKVDEAILLKSGSEIHFPAIELSGKTMAKWYKSAPQKAKTASPARNSVTAAAAAPACPANVKSEIEKHVKQIKSSAEKLKKIDWRKYATIGGMAVALITSTIQAATSLIPIAGPAIAGGLLIAKVTALYKAVSTLNNLEEWAKSETKLMMDAKNNLEKLKSKYPACFK